MRIARVGSVFLLGAACGGLSLHCGGGQSDPEATVAAGAATQAASPTVDVATESADTAADRAQLIRAEEAALEKVTHVRVRAADKPLHTVTDGRLVAAYVQSFDPQGRSSASKSPDCRPQLSVELTDDSGAVLVSAVFCEEPSAAVARFGGAAARRLSDTEAEDLKQLAAGGQAPNHR